MRNIDRVLPANVIRNINENEKKSKRKINVGSLMILLLLFLFTVGPMYIMLVTSVETYEETNYAKFVWWPAEGPTFASYLDILIGRNVPIDLMKSLWNTIWMYVPSIVVGILVSTMAGYSFAKLDFRMKNFMFAVLMATMMIPNCMSMISSFLMYDAIGWSTTPYPLMIPRLFGTMSVVFFIKQYLASLPADIINAAKIDGAGNYTIFFYIVIGVARPVMIAQFVICFIAAYNDYTNPLLYIHDDNFYPLQLALAFFQDPWKNNWPQRMAGCVITMIPLALLYIVSQKYILKGMSMSFGLKG